MKIKKQIIMAAVLALAVGSQAQNYWADSDGIGNWSTTNNWSLGHVPVVADTYALINAMNTGWPTVDSNVPDVQILGIGWGSDGELNVINGGALGAVHTRVGGDALGTLNISGGILTTIVVLEIGQGTGTGTVNLTGNGVLYSIDTTPTWTPGSVINISDSAIFLINGNQTNQTWVADGLIVAPGSGESISVSYDPDSNRTFFRALPAAGPAVNLTISPGVGEVVLSWTAEPQGTYGVETNLDLTTTANWGLWQTGLVLPGGGTLSVTNAVHVDQTFYRVITE